jgi:hypothetical protein
MRAASRPVHSFHPRFLVVSEKLKFLFSTVTDGTTVLLVFWKVSETSLFYLQHRRITFLSLITAR